MVSTRRLAAIFAADIVGYRRLMGLDEAGTAQALPEHRSAADPLIAGHGGRIAKTTGDGILIERWSARPSAYPQNEASNVEVTGALAPA